MILDVFVQDYFLLVCNISASLSLILTRTELWTLLQSPFPRGHSYTEEWEEEDEVKSNASDCSYKRLLDAIQVEHAAMTYALSRFVFSRPIKKRGSNREVWVLTHFPGIREPGVIYLSPESIRVPHGYIKQFTIVLYWLVCVCVLFYRRVLEKVT